MAMQSAATAVFQQQVSNVYKYDGIVSNDMVLSIHLYLYK